MGDLRDGPRAQARGFAFAGSQRGRIGRCRAGGFSYPSRTDGSVRWRSPSLEDKIVQRATATVLNAIYAADFFGFSYGFRPERGAHDAMDALVVGITAKKVNWILDADIETFFDEGEPGLARPVR